MAKIRFSDRKIAGLTPEGGRTYSDSETPGLQLIVGPAGKVFALRARFPDGKRAQIQLGHFPDKHTRELRCPECLTVAAAREKAVEMRVDIGRGIDPRKPRSAERLGTSFEAVANRYFLRGATHRAAASLEEDRRIINKDVLPARTVHGIVFGNMAVTDIGPDEILAVIDNVLERGSGVMANRTRSAIGVILSYAQHHERLIRFNPVRLTRKPYKEKPRQRVLSDKEIRTFWTELDKGGDPRQPPETPDFFKLILTTACRRDELRKMRWSDIDFEGEVWEIPPTIDLGDGQAPHHLIKNEIPHRVPVIGLTREILLRLRSQAGTSPWVFPGPDPSRPRGRFDKAREAYRRAAELEPFTAHDLRATAATVMARCRIEERVIGLCLNHKPRGVTSQVYLRDKQRSYPEVVRAYEALHRHLQGLLSDETSSNVLVFR